MSRVWPANAAQALLECTDRHAAELNVSAVRIRTAIMAALVLGRG